MRQCVAAFIVQKKKVLLGKRSAMREFYPDIWDVFGGHQKAGESREQTLKRELGEELGIIPTGWKFLLTVDDPNPAQNGAGLYHFYLITDFDGEPANLQPEEHAFVEWFNFKDAINLPFAHPLYAQMILQIEQEIE